MSGRERKQRVVVVEDHPGLREQVSEMLEEAGYEVTSASDARAARNVLLHAVPDLVCIDLVLPEGSGYDLCEFVRTTPELKQTRVLVMSGRSLPTDRAFAEEAGAEAFLAKPFTETALLTTARVLLQSNAPTNEAA